MVEFNICKLFTDCFCECLDCWFHLPEFFWIKFDGRLLFSFDFVCCLFDYIWGNFVYRLIYYILINLVVKFFVGYFIWDGLRFAPFALNGNRYMIRYFSFIFLFIIKVNLMSNVFEI